MTQAIRVGGMQETFDTKESRPYRARSSQPCREAA